MFGKRVKVLRTNTESHATVQRSDLGCGVSDCGVCLGRAHDGYVPVLSSSTAVMVPDADTVLHYTDVLETPLVSNVLLLSTVLSEVHRRNRGVSARLQRLTSDPLRKFYVFANDKSISTSVERSSHETEAEYSFRCLRSAVAWLGSHLATSSTASFVAVTANDDSIARLTALAVPIKAQPLRDYVEAIYGVDCPLLDRLTAVAAAIASGDARGGAFEAYLSEDQVAAGVTAGELLRAKLRASEGSCFFGEVRGNFGPGIERVLLVGRGAMNRAVHDDLVAVRMHPPEQWRAPQGADSSSVAPSDRDEALRNGFTPTGRVVAVIEKNRRPYCGSIDLADGEAATGMSGAVSVLFRPKSNRIPRIRISTQNVTELKNKRLRVVIDDWPVTSAYPMGHYVDVVGVIGDKDTEATVILLENDIPHYDFSEDVYDCLPKGAWAPEPSEIARRRDMRDLCICSVDPLGCRDIDDALHWRRLPNGNCEVGVHIADVSHFVQEGAAIDLEAQKRSTSVYLVDRRINMLPQLLTENLCSIVGDEERYAFSGVWEFEGDTLNVVSEWFGKSIIRSKAALYYGDAQKIIDDGEDRSELAVSLRGLMGLSRKLKKQRDEAGALTLGSQEFKFKIDNDHVNPTDMVTYATFETNSMIEEWMLYANVAAAKRIYKHYPSHAMLRRHQAPAERACDELNKALAARGLKPLDTSTSKALNESLNACIDAKDPFINRLVRILTTRCLKQAQYFCSGDLPFDEFLHYGLAMPIYTHFTSPIRRYADVVVHRQLAAITGYGDFFSVERVSTEQIAAVATNINYRHEQAQRAGRDSQNLYTGFFLRNFGEGNIPPEEGYVVRVSETHVAIMVPRYGQEGRVPVEEVQRKYSIFDRVRVKIRLVKEGDVCSAKLAYSIDELEEAGLGHPDSKRNRSEG